MNNLMSETCKHAHIRSNDAFKEQNVHKVKLMKHFKSKQFKTAERG